MTTCLSGAPTSHLGCSQQRVRTRGTAFGVAGRRQVRVSRQQLVCQAQKVPSHKRLRSAVVCELCDPQQARRDAVSQRAEELASTLSCSHQVACVCRLPDVPQPVRN